MYFQEFFPQNLRRGRGVNFKNIYNSNASVNGNFENSSPLKLHLISFFILNNKYYYSFIVFVYHIKRPLKFCISSFSVHFLFLIIKITILFMVYIQCTSHVILLFYFFNHFPHSVLYQSVILLFLQSFSPFIVIQKLACIWIMHVSVVNDSKSISSFHAYKRTQLSKEQHRTFCYRNQSWLITAIKMTRMSTLHNKSPPRRVVGKLPYSFYVRTLPL